MKSTIGKRRYRINPETLQLEHIEHGFRYWLRRSGGYIIGGVCLGIIFFYVFLYAGGPDADRALRPFAT